MPSAGGESDELSLVIQPLAERLLAEIRRSLEYFTTQEDGVPVTKILITGGGAKIKGIKEFFNDRLKLEILDLEVFGKAKLPSTGVADPSAYQSSYGLALRLLNPTDLSLNLLPSDLLQEIAAARKALWLRYLAILGVILLLEGLVWSGATYYKRKMLIERLTVEYEGEVKVGGKPFLIDKKPVRNPQVIDTLEKIKENRNQLQNRFKTISDLEQNRYDWIAIMAALQEVIPSNTWISGSNLTFSPSSGLTLNLKTFDEKAPRELFQRVKNSKYLSYNTTGINVTRNQENGVNVWSWTVTLGFKFQPLGSADVYPEGATPAVPTEPTAPADTAAAAVPTDTTAATPATDTAVKP